MLSSITPLGERGRGRRWGATVAWYVGGSVAGGAGLGAVLGAVGQLLPLPPPPAALALVGVALGCAAVLDAGVVALRVPMVRRQVSEDWLRLYRGWVIGAGYGIQLGAGFATIVSTATVHVTFAVALLTGSWAAGTAIGATFGLVRALPVLGLARVTSAQQLGAVHRRLAAWAPWARRTAVSLAGCGAVVLLAGRGW